LAAAFDNMGVGHDMPLSADEKPRARGNHTWAAWLSCRSYGGFCWRDANLSPLSASLLSDRSDGARMSALFRPPKILKSRARVVGGASPFAFLGVRNRCGILPGVSECLPWKSLKFHRRCILATIQIVTEYPSHRPPVGRANINPWSASPVRATIQHCYDRSVGQRPNDGAIRRCANVQRGTGRVGHATTVLGRSARRAAKSGDEFAPSKTAAAD
jgi:hypothetical protein